MASVLDSFKGLPPAARYGLLGAVGVGGFTFYKRWKAAKTGTSTATGSNSPSSLTVAGTAPTMPLDWGSGSNAGPGTTGPASAPTKTMAEMLGFLNPNVPVVLANNQLFDTGTGRKGYYGPLGQPGGPVPTSGKIPTGAQTWVQPGGQNVWYLPNSYTYGDPNRTPVAPWQMTPAQSNSVRY